VSLFVLDASVAIKWFLPENHSEAACRLLAQQHSLYAPDLIFSEFANVLWKRVWKNEISKNEADSTLEGLLALHLQVQPSQSLMPLALEIACRVNRTVYDSLYLAGAIVLSSLLVTADGKFYRALSKGPLAAQLLWVEDIPQ
jgi:predicted nucleic acid-binding protein